MDNDDKSIELFISAIQERPHLFDKKQVLYKDNIAKENGWKTVGLTMNITGTEAQEQFAKLRQRYRQEQKRIKENTVSGSGSYKETNWPFFNMMGFIDGHIQRRKTKSNYNKEANATTSNKMPLIETITVEMEDQLTDSEVFNLSEIMPPMNVLSEVEGCSDEQVIKITDQVKTGSPSNFLSPRSTHSEASTLRKQHTINKNKEDQVYSTLNNTLQKFGTFMENRNVSSDVSLEELETGKLIAKELTKVKGKKKRLELKAAIFSLIANYISDDDE